MVAQFAHAIAKSRFDIRRRCGRDPFQQLVIPHQGPLGSDGGSAGTAWPTPVIRCRCLPGDERGNPHLGENTDFKHDRVGRSLAISGAAAKLIIEHKQHMRERFPDTALADLALLP